MRSTLLVALALVLLVSLSTSALAVGEAGVPSLIIPPGARANGMGESFVAIADDATAAWWNVGGLAFLKNRNLALMHSQLVPDLANDVYYEYLGFTNEFENFGTLSVAVIYLTYGESKATDPVGTELGTFKSWEATIMVSFAMPVTENVGVGLTGKFIHADLAPGVFTQDNLDGKASTVAVDAGLLWRLPKPRLRFGVSLNNLGPDITFIDQDQSDPLPITLRFGTVYNPVASEVNNLLLTFDVEQSLVWLVDSSTNSRRSEIWHIGTEYRYINLLAGRLGYIYDEDGNFNDATYGLGFIYKGKVSLDYANVPQAETLDRVHRWSISVSF